MIFRLMPACGVRRPWTFGGGDDGNSQVRVSCPPGRIVRAIMALAVMASGPAWPAGTGEVNVVAELKVFLSQKEAELAQLVVERKTKLREADLLAKKVEGQKERKNPNWFERRVIARNLSKLRTEFSVIERVTVREQTVREEAFACAAAIVAELESSLERQLTRLHREQRVDADLKRRYKRVVPFKVHLYSFTKTGAAIERAMALEKERKFYQHKMNELTPHIPIPAELPKGVEWSKEMIEDQRSAYESNIARLQSEREQLVQEKRLRKNLADTLAKEIKAGSEMFQSRIDTQVVDYDRKIRMYQKRLNQIPALPRPAFVDDGPNRAKVKL